MTSELITFNLLRYHSSSTALGTKLELVTESQLGEVQIKAGGMYLIFPIIIIVIVTVIVLLQSLACTFGQN